MSLLALVLSLFVAGSIPIGSALPLMPVGDLPLPGHASRFDYQAVDAASRRLYIAHLGDSALVVFDLDQQRVVREVTALPSVHGVAVAADRHEVLATATAEKTLAIVDAATLQVRARVPAGEYPNGLAYDPVSGRAFVSNNRGVGVAVIDLATAHALQGIDVGGGAGNTQYDAASGHVFAAVHGRPYLAEIDPVAARVTSRIALHGARSCHGLLVVSALHLAFAACGGAGPSLIAVDLATRRPIANLPMPPDADVLAFDSGLRRLYVASEPGVLAVFDVGADGHVAELGRGFVGPNAHSVAVDPITHRVYFPLADVGGHPVLRVFDAR